jgi:hypothetical protein
MSPKVTIDTLEKILNRNLAWISAADAKVAHTLAISTAMLGTLAAFFASAVHLSWIPIASLCASVLLLLLCVLFLGMAIFPRTRGPVNSVIFFEAIAGMPKARYFRIIAELTDDDLYHDFAEQAHRNAEIATAKYKSIRCAMACLLASIPLWLISIWQLWQFRR